MSIHTHDTPEFAEACVRARTDHYRKRTLAEKAREEEATCTCPIRTTYATVRTRPARFFFSVTGYLRPSQRRALLLGIIERIQELAGGEHGRWHMSHGPSPSGQFGPVRDESRRLSPSPEKGGTSQRLGDLIRLRRLEIGLTQAEIARKVGMDRTHLSTLERNRHLPRPETLARLEQVLGMRISPHEEPHEECLPISVSILGQDQEEIVLDLE